MEPPMNTGTPPDAGGGPIADWEGYFARRLASVPLVVILRGLAPDAATSAAEAAWDAGVRLVEVTVESDVGLPALEAVVGAAPPGCPVGAGTVTTPERLTRAADAGAQFGVAPGLDPDTVRAADDLRMPFLPGIATPTEAGQALRLGLTTVKVFPASTLGAGWISAIAGPYPTLRTIATGGVTAQTAPDYLRAGALAVGVGSSITSGDGLDALVHELGRR